METLRGLYRQLDDRVRDLSRVSYSLLLGLVTAMAVVAVRIPLSGQENFESIAIGLTMGITMAVVSYAFDPNTTSE